MAVKHLIDTFVPENYKIFLDIDRKTKTFKGQVAVTGEAKDVVVAFHTKGLHFNKVRAFSVDTSFIENYEDEEIIVKVGEKGRVTISFDYEAELTDNMMGIYPSYYKVNGEDKMLVSTQFESHFARQAFPCIDEPAAKATFDLSVKFDEGPDDIIIANMPELMTVEGIHIFQRTVKMSSYLLAFALGEFQYKKGKTKSGVEVGTFATKAHPAAALDFPLEIAIQAIDFYEDYYKTPYPLPHSWHVALPDFSAGAMENWGCITYREVCMLVDPANATEASKQYVATVICHELAHQWFGDLVTMEWWDDLWLNESFANNMEYVSVDAIHPEWKIWEQFSFVEANMALNRDATDGVQSVHVEVTHPDEINTLFDPAIVYAKGSRLMVMLNKWLGKEAFAKGLHDYFEANKYSNTTGDDLWNALSRASGKNVAAFMHSWINQPGYPVVDAKLENGTLTLTQRQFFIGEGEDKGRLWQIPLNSNYAELPDILGTEKVVVENFKLEDGKPLLLNDENAAHYIINYHGELLDSILENLSGLTNITKFQILQDRKNLANAELISFGDVVKLLPYYAGEKTYLVAQAVNQLIATIRQFIDEDSAEEKNLKAIVEKLFAADYARLGWDKVEDESSNDQTQRSLVLSLMTFADNADAKAKASSIFAAHRDKIQSISADIRPIVLNNEIKTAQSETLVKEFVELYTNSATAEFKDELAAAWSQAKSPEITDYLLELMKNGTIKPQDIAGRWFRVLSHEFSQDKAWSWAKENWDWIISKLGGDMSFDKFVIYPANIFKTADKLEAYKEFFVPKLDVLGLSRSIKMGIKQIEARVKLIDNQKADVVAALDEVADKL